MSVRELIAKLQKLDPEMQIYAASDGDMDQQAPIMRVGKYRGTCVIAIDLRDFEESLRLDLEDEIRAEYE